jgi:hypothetical protein
MPGVDFYKKRAAAEAAMARMKEKASVKADEVNAERTAGMLGTLPRPMNRAQRRAAAAREASAKAKEGK